jgi:hypothetical protein
MPASEHEWSTQGDFHAECMTCGWECKKPNALGAGSQHARRNKHSVRVTVERSRIYDYGGFYFSSKES